MLKLTGSRIFWPHYKDIFTLWFFCLCLSKRLKKMKSNDSKFKVSLFQNVLLVSSFRIKFLFNLFWEARAEIIKKKIVFILVKTMTPKKDISKLTDLYHSKQCLKHWLCQELMVPSGPNFWEFCWLTPSYIKNWWCQFVSIFESFAEWRFDSVVL